MADNVYPEKGDRLLVDPGRQMFRDPFGGQKHVQTGYTFVSSALLDVTVAAGTAFANGTRVDRDVTTVLGMTASSTNYIYVYFKDDLDDNIVYFHVDQDDTPPVGYTATSLKIMEVTTNATVVTGNTDTRTLAALATPVRIGALAGTADIRSGDVAGRSRIQLSSDEDRLLFDGLTGAVQPVHFDLFRNTNTGGVRDFRIFEGDGTATVLLEFSADNGRLELNRTSVVGGILIGGDAHIYRSAADVLHTPDTFESELSFFGRSGGGAGVAFRVGNDAEIHDVNVADELAIVGVQTPANGRLAFGSAADVVLFRGAADRLDLAGGDFFRWVGGTSDPAGLADGAVWYRTDTDRLRLRAAGTTEDLAYRSDTKLPGTREGTAVRTSNGTNANDPSTGYAAFLLVEVSITGATDAVAKVVVIFDDDTTFDLLTGNGTLGAEAIVDTLGTRTLYIKRIDFTVTSYISGTINFAMRAWQF